MIKELIARCQQGDKAAWELIYRSYRQQALAFARRLSGSYHGAEDLVQEAFLRLLKSISDFRGESSFRGWFFQIIRNLDRDEKRKKQRTQSRQISLEILAEKKEELKSAEGDDPQRGLEFSLFKESLRKVIRGLPDKDRMVLFLREFKDYSYQEIASQLQLSVEAVRARLYRTRRLLREVCLT